jgi:BirA family biotin operon repressor/biotin-[acetyl-CoA-carboxylase] ligase
VNPEGQQLPAGYTLHAFDRVESTNDEARKMAEQGAPAGTVVVAREQTRGRGRHGRTWQSPPGNLYATLVLRPECPMAETAQLSLIASVALAEALAGLGPPNVDVRLKWPNDVLIYGAKVAGILLEGVAGANRRAAWVVIGSGVNIASAPLDTPYPATWLGSEGFPPVAPIDVLGRYLGALDRWLDRWRSGGFAAARRAWLAHSSGVGSHVRLRLDQGDLEGRFVDLTARGALLLELESGRRREITAGELLYLER